MILTLYLPLSVRSYVGSPLLTVSLGPSRRTGRQWPLVDICFCISVSVCVNTLLLQTVSSFHTHTHTRIHSSPHTHWGLLDQTGATVGMDSPSRIQTEWGQRVWLAQSPASGPGGPPLRVGVGAAGVVGSGSAPSLWEPGNKGPYSALAVSAPPCQGRLPSGKGMVRRWAVLPGRLSLWHGPQQGRRI